MARGEQPGAQRTSTTRDGRELRGDPRAGGGVSVPALDSAFTFATTLPTGFAPVPELELAELEEPAERAPADRFPPISFSASSNGFSLLGCAASIFVSVIPAAVEDVAAAAGAFLKLGSTFFGFGAEKNEESVFASFTSTFLSAFDEPAEPLDRTDAFAPDADTPAIPLFISDNFLFFVLSVFHFVFFFVIFGRGVRFWSSAK